MSCSSNCTWDLSGIGKTQRQNSAFQRTQTQTGCGTFRRPKVGYVARRHTDLFPLFTGCNIHSVMSLETKDLRKNVCVVDAILRRNRYEHECTCHNRDVNVLAERRHQLGPIHLIGVERLGALRVPATICIGLSSKEQVRTRFVRRPFG